MKSQMNSASLALTSTKLNALLLKENIPQRRSIFLDKYAISVFIIAFHNNDIKYAYLTISVSGVDFSWLYFIFSTHSIEGGITGKGNETKR